MAGFCPPELRQEVANRDDVADIRSAGFALTRPGGHPKEIFDKVDSAGPPPGCPPGHSHIPAVIRDAPTVNTPEEAAAFVAEQIAEGSDYIKVMIEEGTVLDASGLPLLTSETFLRGVEVAHEHGKLVVAHALTKDATARAIAAGVDGLAHLFVDGPPSEELIRRWKETGAFVTPCMCLNRSIMGHAPQELANDERISSRLPPPWQKSLLVPFNTYPQGDFANVLMSAKALRDAGIDVLVGTDVAGPSDVLGGLAHGASVHHEMQLFVEAGWTPTEALIAATSLPAKRFHLEDRGRIAPGLRADLLLVRGDPTARIGDSLNIEGIWRRGARLTARS